MIQYFYLNISVIKNTSAVRSNIVVKGVDLMPDSELSLLVVALATNPFNILPLKRLRNIFFVLLQVR